jgi:putative CocE/NonD family hydrolase
VLTYTSATLSHDLTVVGQLTVHLHLRSSLDHTDFFVRLCDVSSKGRSVNLSDGIVHVTPLGVTRDADGTFSVTLELWPTANTFKAGHRIRLQVSSGAHPLFARNTGSGDPLATASTLRVADVEVWRDAAHPSCLVLPVVH